MLLSYPLALQQAILICSILLASGLGVLFLRRRGHLQSLREVRIPLLGFVLFGVCDALVTLHGTWQAPWREANPSMRAFLTFGGWWGQCLGSALWILAWAVVLDMLESWRCKVSANMAARVSVLRLWIIYALAVGHLNGFVSWAAPRGPLEMLFAAFYRFWSHTIGWLGPLSPFGYPLYSGLFFGGICALAHILVSKALLRSRPGTELEAPGSVSAGQYIELGADPDHRHH